MTKTTGTAGKGSVTMLPVDMGKRMKGAKGRVASAGCAGKAPLEPLKATVKKGLLQKLMTGEEGEGGGGEGGGGGGGRDKNVDASWRKSVPRPETPPRSPWKYRANRLHTGVAPARSMPMVLSRPTQLLDTVLMGVGRATPTVVWANRENMKSRSTGRPKAMALSSTEVRSTPVSGSWLLYRVQYWAGLLVRPTKKGARNVSMALQWAWVRMAPDTLKYQAE
ncbi:hypothetical protein V8C86DRAFT_2719547 [Haematococcus lacustris]